MMPFHHLCLVFRADISIRGVGMICMWMVKHTSPGGSRMISMTYHTVSGLHLHDANPAQRMITTDRSYRI